MVLDLKFTSLEHNILTFLWKCTSMSVCEASRASGPMSLFLRCLSVVEIFFHVNRKGFLRKSIHAFTPVQAYRVWYEYAQKRSLEEEDLIFRENPEKHFDTTS